MELLLLIRVEINEVKGEIAYNNCHESNRIRTKHVGLQADPNCSLDKIVC